MYIKPYEYFFSLPIIPQEKVLGSLLKFLNPLRAEASPRWKLQKHEKKKIKEKKMS